MIHISLVVLQSIDSYVRKNWHPYHRVSEINILTFSRSSNPFYQYINILTSKFHILSKRIWREVLYCVTKFCQYWTAPLPIWQTFLSAHAVNIQHYPTLCIKLINISHLSLEKQSSFFFLNDVLTSTAQHSFRVIFQGSMLLISTNLTLQHTV